jgi:hypothetical protein
MDEDADLTLLGKIRPGETINLTTRELVIHRSWYASYTRWWNEEQRDNIPEWIDNVMKRELNALKIMHRKDLIEVQKTKILVALSGIRNLCVTYVGDPVATKLTLTISQIEEQLWRIEHPATHRINIHNPHSHFSHELPFPSTF